MINEYDLAQLRREYTRHELTESSVSPDPFAQFTLWFNEALSAEIPEPNAMTVATVGRDGRPEARIVLLKGFSNQGFVFFTNYESRKGRSLVAEPRCTLHFFWQELERQVILNGKAEKTSVEESEAYFRSRPLQSRLAAWASSQSTAIGSRAVLEENFAQVTQRFAGGEVPLPPFWGGFRVIPDNFEFWQGRPNRLHDRICFELGEEGWRVYRLSP
ncbi:MAG: pyridoxamine 5'-phosphate oxidase [Pyrinomonadaceae bacterium]